MCLVLSANSSESGGNPHSSVDIYSLNYFGRENCRELIGSLQPIIIESLFTLKQALKGHLPEMQRGFLRASAIA